jgi:hypothetical protein
MRGDYFLDIENYKSRYYEVDRKSFLYWRQISHGVS